MNDQDKVEKLRAEMPVLQRVAYLNTGSAGPLPQTCVEAMARAAEDDFRRGRASIPDVYKLKEQMNEIRRLAARLLGAEASSIALTNNTSDGMNIALWGINWQPGDEIISTGLEHGAALVPLSFLRQRFGVTARFVDIGLGEKALNGIARAFSRRTRLVAVSHVTYSSGALLPLAEIVSMAHERGAMVLGDGAQAVGAVPVDVGALDIDFYAIPGQKWLCGPEGVGALYVRPDRIDDLLPTFCSYMSVDGQDNRGFVLPAGGARRYEVAIMNRPNLAGFQASLRWMLEEVGIEWATRRTLEMAQRCRELLATLDGVTVLTPPQQQAGLICFDLAGWSPAAQAGLVPALEERGYVVRSIAHHPYCMRVSSGFFNTEAELGGLRDALAELMASGPDAISIPDWAISLPREYSGP
jgi:L-cysteine/cystine lyase